MAIGKGSLYNIVDIISIYHGHSTVSGVGGKDESGRR